MEMLKTPLVDVTARLDPGLLSDATIYFSSFFL